MIDIEEKTVEFDIDKCRNVFEREKRQALVAADELYGDNISKEKAMIAKKELGEETYKKSLAEIRKFNKELSKRIRKITLEKEFEELEFKRTVNAIGVTLDHAMRQFNWDNPILDYIEEVQ